MLIAIFIFHLISLLLFIGIPIALIVWMVKRVNRIEVHLETIATHLETIAKNMEKRIE